jgi:hypothetical protein
VRGSAGERTTSSTASTTVRAEYTLVEARMEPTPNGVASALTRTIPVASDSIFQVLLS